MESKIKDGDIQNSIYLYLEELAYSNKYYSMICDNILIEDTVCEYFCGYFGEEYIDDISNSNNEMAQLLQEIIICVYRRFASEIDKVVHKNNFIRNTMNFQNELRIYEKKSPTEKEKANITKIAMQYYKYIKDIQF